MAAFSLVKLEKEKGGLRITARPGAIDDLRECADLEDAIDWELCNGWTRIRPEECGALTEGLLLTDDWDRDDDGTLTHLGEVYWDADYAVRDALAEIIERGSVVLIGSA